MVHADYSQIGSPIRLAFFDNRIEIDNPGILLPGLTVEDLKEGVSKIRNRVIARIFRELNLIEQWGSGLPRIFDEARTLKLRSPELVEIGSQVRFTIYLDDLNKRGKAGAESGAESEMPQKILENLEIKDLSKKSISQLFGKESPSRYLNKLMRQLIQNGLVEYTKPEKPTSRLQKYRLTKKGKSSIKK